MEARFGPVLTSSWSRSTAGRPKPAAESERRWFGLQNSGSPSLLTRTPGSSGSSWKLQRIPPVPVRLPSARARAAGRTKTQSRTILIGPTGQRMTSEDDYEKLQNKQSRKTGPKKTFLSEWRAIRTSWTGPGSVLGWHRFWSNQLYYQQQNKNT